MGSNVIMCKCLFSEVTVKGSAALRQYRVILGFYDVTCPYFCFKSLRHINSVRPAKSLCLYFKQLTDKTVLLGKGRPPAGLILPFTQHVYQFDAGQLCATI